MSILLRFTVPIKWLLAEMTGHLSLDTLRETRLAHIKDTLLEPIFIQLQGYPLRCLTTLNFSIFSLTKLDFTYYSLLCFVICSYKLYQGEAISLNVFPPDRAICRDRFWSVKMDTSLDLTMTDGWFSSEVLRSLPKFSALERGRVLWNHLANGHLRSSCRPAEPIRPTPLKIYIYITFFFQLTAWPKWPQQKRKVVSEEKQVNIFNEYYKDKHFYSSE